MIEFQDEPSKCTTKKYCFGRDETREHFLSLSIAPKVKPIGIAELLILK